MKTLKRIISILLIAAMVFGLAACGEKKNEPKVPTVDPDDPTAKLKLTLDEWPVIDGALAMIPYYEEMAARILDMPVEEAKEHVLSNNTPQAFKNLAEGTVDMIFCAPPSEEQIAYAKQNGVEFESVQVLNSGFVFFVNKDNPVNNLTSQQLHDIYAGKITNWKEVGGNEEPIIAYQRAEGSGSQTGLYEHVIPQNEVMDPPLTQRLGAMSEIIDAVANYDNAKGALGFSYYYYVTNMHYQEDVKLIAIDNIYPTPETITTEMYPFISKTCAIFNANEPEDSVVRKIAAWCHGSAGVAMSCELGYVPSGETYVIPGYGDNIKTHEETRMVKGNNIKVQSVAYEPDASGYSSQSFVEISGLKDKTVQKKINDTIRAEFDNYIGDQWLINLFDPDFKCDAYNIYCYASEMANYANILSIEMYCTLSAYQGEDYYYFNKCIPFNFDLRTGEQLKITDLFNDPDNGIAYINSKVYDYINDGNYMEEGQDNWWDYNPIQLAAPFRGIKDTQKFLISYNGMIDLLIDEDTPEFYVNNQSQSIYIEGRNIIDFDKFESKENLFEDEAESVHLFSREYSGYSDSHDFSSKLDDIWPQDDGQLFLMNDVTWYDEMTAAQKDASQAHFEEIREIAKKFLAKADSYRKKESFFGDFRIMSYPSRYGNYVNVYEGAYGNLSFMDKGDWMGLAYNYDFNNVFEEGNDTPLTLEDFFKPGTDYKAVIEDAIVKELKMSRDVEISDENVLRAMAADASENIRSFAVNSDGLMFYYDDPNEIVGRNASNLIPEENYWYYSTCFRDVSFRCLDCRNLKISMIK